MHPLIDHTHYIGNPLAAPRCPRCGYDVNGIAATWREFCDVRGTCSECGFEFAWRDVFRPEQQLPRWLVEYSQGRTRTFIAAWLTMLAAVFPPLFFARVKLWHAPVARRLMWWLPLMLLLAYGTVTVLRLCFLWLMFQSTPVNGVISTGYQNYAASGEEWVSYLNEIVAPLGSIEGRVPPEAMKGVSASTWRATWRQSIKWEFTFRHTASGEWILIALSLAWPVALLLLRPTRRMARIRNAHVLRASIYSLWWIVVCAWFWVLVRTLWAIDGLSEAYISGAGLRPLRALVESDVWYQLWSPIEALSDVGVELSLASMAIGAVIVCLQIWWWHTVIVRHWRLPRGGMAFALIGIIAGCLAILAAIGPLSIRYIFMNL